MQHRHHRRPRRQPPPGAAGAAPLTRMSRRVDILTLQKISGHVDIGQLASYYRESPADIAKRL